MIELLRLATLTLTQLNEAQVDCSFMGNAGPLLNFYLHEEGLGKTAPHIKTQGGN